MTDSTNPTQKFTRSELVSRLVRAGELEVSGEDQAEVDTVPRPGEPRAFGVIEDLLALFSGRRLSGAGDDRRRSLS